MVSEKVQEVVLRHTVVAVPVDYGKTTRNVKTQRAVSLKAVSPFHDSAASGDTLWMGESSSTLFHSSFHNHNNDDDDDHDHVRCIREAQEQVPNHHVMNPYHRFGGDYEEGSMVDDSIEDSVGDYCAIQNDNDDDDYDNDDCSLNIFDYFAATPTRRAATVARDGRNDDNDDGGDGDETIFDSIDGDDPVDQTTHVLRLRRAATSVAAKEERHIQKKVLQQLRASVGVLAMHFPRDLDEGLSDDTVDSNETAAAMVGTLTNSYVRQCSNHHDIPLEITMDHYARESGGYVAFVGEGDVFPCCHQQGCDCYCWEALA